MSGELKRARARERYALNRAKELIRVKAWQAANKARVSLTQEAYRTANREKLKAMSADRYRAHIEKYRSKARKQYAAKYAANPEKERERGRKRYAANIEKERLRSRTRSRNRNRASRSTPAYREWCKKYYSKNRQKHLAAVKQWGQANREAIRVKKLMRRRKKTERRRIIHFYAASQPQPIIQMKPAIKNLKEELIAIHQGIIGSMEDVLSFCRRFVVCLDQDAQKTRAILQERGVAEGFMDLWENVGRGRVHPKLMFNASPGAERLQMAPYSEQDRLLTTGVQVARLIHDEVKIVVVPVSQLSKAEALSAINSSGNVGKELQIENLEEMIQKRTHRPAPYRLKGEDVYADKGSTIRFVELERLYFEAKKIHEAKLQSIEAAVKQRQIVKK